MIDDAATTIVAFMFAGPHVFTLDNCHLNMDAPHKSEFFLADLPI